MVATDTRIFRVRLFWRKCLHNLLKSEVRTVGNECLFMAKTTRSGSDFSVRSNIKANLEIEMKEKITI